MGRARGLSEGEGVPLPTALARMYEFTRQRVQRRVEIMEACSVPGEKASGEAAPSRFLCDASLGGLARWLRAAGYEATWLFGVAGDALIAETRHGGILLTTDSRLWDRRAIRDGTVRAEWIPCHLDPVEQVGLVLRDLSLPLREPRCMACGGELHAVRKDDVRERIPPRTALWKDDYFVCAGCGKLFWQGTHWERIHSRLRSASATTSLASRP